VTAPPAVGIFDFRKDPGLLQRFDHTHWQEVIGERIPRARDDVEVADSSLELISDSFCRGRAIGEDDFQFDAEPFPDGLFQRLAQIGARRDADDELSFLPRGSLHAFPFRLPLRLC
jgi:hypothetical protein